ncbi:MAG: exonuclease [Marinibacterium sp.]
MSHAIFFDCEFLTADGAPQRFWCGPHDPDPVIAQIGLVKLGLTKAAPILDRLRIYVIPPTRTGARAALDPLFTRLTGITEADIEEQGLALGDALARVESFSDGATLWSWGKDEFNMVAMSCYVAGIVPPIPVTRFANACHLLLTAGMPLDDLHNTRSDRLSAYFGLKHPPLRGHDALDDAMSVTLTVQHLIQAGRLPLDAFLSPK